MQTKTSSSATTALLIVVVMLFTFPIWIGLLGGLFGLVMGLLGGLIGLVAGIFGSIFGILGSVFGWLFDWGGPFHFHFPFGIFKLIFFALIIAVVVLASRSRKKP
jgi:hypothetical protein